VQVLIIKVEKKFRLPNKNTLFVGKVSYRFPALSSTNDYAAELILKEQPSEGTVIIADYQSAGRGQLGNSWEAEAGQNLTLSLILYPRFLLARQQFDLNQSVALAVRDTIATFTDKPVHIKWPNDILIGKRKISGVLIQNILSGLNIRSSIAGIGINANQQQFAAGLTHAGSIRLETGKAVDLNKLEQQLFRFLESWYLRLKNGGIATIRAAYLRHLFQMEEKQSYAFPDGQIFQGTITGIDPSGKLMMETETGPALFGIKDLKYLL